MTLSIGDTAPDFEADTTQGRIKFHEWLGDSWGVLFSHPKDFTPVCITELGYMAKINPDFKKRNVKIIGLSVDAVDNHGKWAKDSEETQGFLPDYPMIGDTDLSISKAWGMLPAAASGDSAKRTPADNQTVRNVFVIGPDKKLKLILVYPMTTGRNFDEVLRVIDSLQLTAEHKVATPVNWQPGDNVIIAGSVTDEQARETYPDGWESLRPYIRIVPQRLQPLVLPREPAEGGRVDHQQRLAAPLRQRQFSTLDGLESVIEGTMGLGAGRGVCHDQHDGRCEGGEQHPHARSLSVAPILEALKQALVALPRRQRVLDLLADRD